MRLKMTCCKKFKSCTQCVVNNRKFNEDFYCMWSVFDNKCSRGGDYFNYNGESYFNSLLTEPQKCPYLRKNSDSIWTYSGKESTLKSIPTKSQGQTLKFQQSNPFSDLGRVPAEYSDKTQKIYSSTSTTEG